MAMQIGIEIGLGMGGCAKAGPAQGPGLQVPGGREAGPGVEFETGLSAKGCGSARGLTESLIRGVPGCLCPRVGCMCYGDGSGPLAHLATDGSSARSLHAHVCMGASAQIRMTLGREHLGAPVTNSCS